MGDIDFGQMRGRGWGITVEEVWEMNVELSAGVGLRCPIGG